MPVPNIFGTATAAIPLSQLDTNFATPVTIGNTAVQLGNTVTSFGNVTLTNVTISSGNVTVSAGSNTAPSITTVGDTNTGIYFPAADTIAFSEGGVESMRITPEGNVGIGVTPSATWSSTARAIQLGGFNSIFGYTSNVFRLANNAIFTSSNETYGASSIGATYYQQYNGAHSWFNAASGTAGNTISFNQAMTLDASSNLITSGDIYLGGTSTGGAKAAIQYNSIGTVIIQADPNNAGASSIISFNVDASEKARIDSSGNLLVGKNTANDGIAGVQMYGGANAGVVSMVYAGRPLYINRLSTDGDLIDFAQAGTTEGSISVSGTTVSYNGGHLSRYAQTQGTKDESLVKGTVLSNLDEMNVYVAPTTYWTEEDELPEGVSVGNVKVETHSVNNEQLNKVKVSDVEGDANVAGVFVNWSHDEAHDVDEINMAMTGDMIIRIAQGTTVQRGDLLMSAGDGTAKPQGDDIVRSKTVAKVTSTHVTCTYADGSYCVPCVLMAC